MTDNQPSPEQATGTRRAAAFFLHNGRRDLDGVNAILQELGGDQDATLYFLLGLGNVFETLLPVVYSSTGQWLVQQLVADLAGVEHGRDVA